MKLFLLTADSLNFFIVAILLVILIKLDQTFTKGALPLSPCSWL